MITPIRNTDLKYVSISTSRTVTYHKKPWFATFPKCPMHTQLILSSGKINRGTFSIDITEHPDIVQKLQRLDSWAVRIAQKLNWFPDDDPEQLYSSLTYNKDGKELFRVSFPIWGDKTSMEVYDQNKKLLEYPMSALDMLSSIKVLVKIDNIWLTDRGFGWNVVPQQIMIFNDHDLPRGCCMIDTPPVPNLDNWDIQEDPVIDSDTTPRDNGDDDQSSQNHIEEPEIYGDNLTENSPSENTHPPMNDDDSDDGEEAEFQD